MKLFALTALTSSLLVTGCVTGPEVDQATAYEKCQEIKTVTTRDRCYAEALQESARDRHQNSDDAAARDKEAEERALRRIQGGVDPDGNN